MKKPFDRGFTWTLLPNKSSKASLENDNASDIELTHRNDQGPIKTVATFDSFHFRSEAERLSPKRLEDDVAEKLQVDGWRFGASSAAITAGVTGVLNLSVAIWLTATSTSGGDTGDSKVIAELFNGNCARAATMNTWTHLAINIVSTGLLAGSNFCMQCLVAPNRADIDRAHAQGAWLDIGVPSIRNLRHIGLLRSCLWVLLALSSLPLHLLFNSAFFSSIGDNAYDVIFATPGYLDGDSFNYTGAQLLPALDQNADRVQSLYLESADHFTRLSNQDCINAYTADLLTTRGSVIVLTDEQPVDPGNGSVLLSMAMEPISAANGGFYWICTIPYIHTDDGGDRAVQGVPGTYSGYSSLTAPSCSIQFRNGNIVGEGWRPSNITAQACMSENIEQRCGFYANVVILWVVVVCNMIKLVVMTYLIWSPTIKTPLMTIGDAVCSFIVEPDPSTEKLGPISIRLVKQLDKIKKRKAPTRPFWQRSLSPSYPEQPAVERPSEPDDCWTASPSQQWWPGRHGPHFGSAASKTRWTITIAYFIGCLITVAVLLKAGIARLSGEPSWAELYKRGLGKVSPDLIIGGWDIEKMSLDRGIVSSVLVANSPQLALSFLYFAVNTLLTLMASAGEWSRFSLGWTLKHQPRALRTSSPRGDQRRTYFLQLPFRIAVPLIAMSALIHWLISQSIFLAVISQYDHVGEVTAAFAIASCGYSPIGMLYTMIAGSVLILSVATFGLFCLQPGTPIVASCSAAISACCHVNWTTDTGLDEVRMGQEAREAMMKGPIVWGQLVGDNERLKVHSDAENARHCSFVSTSGVDWQDRVRHPAVEQRST